LHDAFDLVAITVGNEVDPLAVPFSTGGRNDQLWPQKPQEWQAGAFELPLFASGEADAPFVPCGISCHFAGINPEV
jgi:hypothetical protein